MDDIEKIIIDYFKKIPYIISVALFGSYAKKTENDSSDVDIAVLYEHAHVPDGFVLIEWREDLSALVGKEIDLICLNTVSPIIRMQVYKYGKVLFNLD